MQTQLVPKWHIRARQTVGQSAGQRVSEQDRERERETANADDVAHLMLHTFEVLVLVTFPFILLLHFVLFLCPFSIFCLPFEYACVPRPSLLCLATVQVFKGQQAVLVFNVLSTCLSHCSPHKSFSKLTRKFIENSVSVEFLSVFNSSFWCAIARKLEVEQNIRYIQIGNKTFTFKL